MIRTTETLICEACGSDAGNSRFAWARASHSAPSVLGEASLCRANELVP